MAPQGWIVDPHLASDTGNHSVANADVRHLHLTAMEPAGKQHMAGLPAHERDGMERLDCCAAHLATVGVDTGRDIHGHNRPAAGVDTLDERMGHPLHIAGEAGAEERIDDYVGFADGGEIRNADRAGPVACRGSRLALQGLPLPE